jgi:hypothetical protein
VRLVRYNKYAPIAIKVWHNDIVPPSLNFKWITLYHSCYPATTKSNSCWQITNYKISPKDKDIKEEVENNTNNVAVSALKYLVDSKARINTGAIDLFSLHIEPSYRRTHSLGAYCNDTNVFGKIKTEGL